MPVSFVSQSSLDGHNLDTFEGHRPVIWNMFLSLGYMRFPHDMWVVVFLVCLVLFFGNIADRILRSHCTQRGM